jgi:hypothetical protein
LDRFFVTQVEPPRHPNHLEYEVEQENEDDSTQSRTKNAELSTLNPEPKNASHPMTPLQPETHALSDPTRTQYGNTLRQMSGPLKAAAAAGAMLGGLGMLSRLSENKLDTPHFLLLLLVVPGIPLLMLLLVSPSFASRIVIRDGMVRHLLFGTRLLSELPLEDYLRVKTHEGGCAAVLHFTEGRRIRIFAMSTPEIERLTADLDSLRRQIAVPHMV